jgi:peptidyl-prolyl cis-trans isomerase SurA
MRLRARICMVFAALLLGAVMGSRAIAVPSSQSPTGGQVVALVNGDPITALDVAQRMRLVELMTHKTPTRQDALEELISEKIKLQQARIQRIEITDAQVDKVFGNMAQRTGRKTAEFAEALT